MAKSNTGSRRLKRFLKSHKLKPADLAKALEVHRAQAGRWLSGTFLPRLWAQEAIAVWTDGEVPVTSWPVKRARNTRIPKVVSFRGNVAHGVEVPQLKRHSV